MELTVLGCHGGESARHRTSSFLLDDVLAIDAGAISGMTSLEAQQAIRAVVVSHAHMDHVRDLATLADNRCQQGGPTLIVAGIAPTIRALREHFFNDVIWPNFEKIPAGSGPTLAFEVLELEERTEIAGFGVTPVAVSHTIDTCGFVFDREDRAIAYSGDTGPTERLWEVLAARSDLRALLMEVSFPNHEHAIAKASGHHTPHTLGAELLKLHGKSKLPTLLYHIKPVFEAAVEKELAALDPQTADLHICRLGEKFRF